MPEHNDRTPSPRTRVVIAVVVVVLVVAALVIVHLTGAVGPGSR